MPGYLASNGPRGDRYTYLTGRAGGSGYEPITGAIVSTDPCVLESCYISISPLLAAPIWILFVDARTSPAAVNVPFALMTSEPLATPGGTFVYQGTSAEEVFCHDPVEITDCGREPIKGVPFDQGLIIIASSIPNGFVAADPNMIRVMARVRRLPDVARRTKSACDRCSA